MKKTLSILFIIVIIFKAGGSSLFFINSIFSWKNYIRNVVSKPSHKKQIIKLTFSKEEINGNNSTIQFIKKNEFKLDGMMYDIVETSITADSVIFICYKDIKETRLLAVFTEHIDKADDEQNSLLKNFNNLFKSPCDYYITIQNMFCTMLRVAGKSYYSSAFFESLISDIPSPPPR